MPALDSKLRSQLDDVCQKARDLAVAYAQSALKKRAVDAAESLSHFGPKDKELRNRLRARGRQVGDARNADGTQSIDQLAQELAYEYWHRMLFARFLAENNLLMHPDGVAVSLEECDELAPTAAPPAANGFVLAARYASKMLPQIFRTDDVLLEIEFAPEQRLAMEKLLASLPKHTFDAGDSLGWVYQFWQTAEKKRVNESGDKIDGRTLPAVTQLFTEHYMVEFLLHNTIGAWWCEKEKIQGPLGGAGIPAGKSPVEMPYLRWRDDGTPAAGKFEGWPKTLAEFKMLDPCCGSGHFLVAAFNLLVPLRMHDEGLTAEQACEAVLRDNIFGLELDPRCTQIAAFALALAAWKYPNASGHRPLPVLNIACSGQGVTGRKDEWLALANENTKLRNGMDRLYDLFKQAPHLGSLIDPRGGEETLFEAGFAELQPLLVKALEKNIGADADLSAVGVAAQGIASAAAIMCRKFTLVATNVPFLGRETHAPVIHSYCTSNFKTANADLATVFIARCLELAFSRSSIAIVAPQNWMFLKRYHSFRKSMLLNSAWNCIARLGPGAFDTISGEVVKVSLLIVTNVVPENDQQLCAIDASSTRDAQEKSIALQGNTILCVPQSDQLHNPDQRIIFSQRSEHSLLSEYAVCLSGLSAGDVERFYRVFWEVPNLGDEWEYLQSTVSSTTEYGGRSLIVLWEKEQGAMFRLAESVRHLNHAAQNWLRGKPLWGKKGICVSQMGDLPVTLYLGDRYNSNCCVICPNDPVDLPALWAYCSSKEFCKDVRNLDQKMWVTPRTLLKVPFDADHWRNEAKRRFPHGLVVTHSNDETQWTFDGQPENSVLPLQVSVARLLGYRWPDQPKAADAIYSLTDSDGIVCLPAVRGEATASERLLDVLHAAYCEEWSDSVLHKFLTDAGCKAGTTLDDWLRNQFFEQHCKRFQNHPFIWHIWDGRKDGFSALVNYHKLGYKALENLTYSYLGDWITAQGKSDKAGADSRLGAAQELQAKLKLILAGDPPYDIFVRWKPLHEQSIGWNPDLNDGVRQNIRPFITAGVLRKEPKSLLKDKDRGSEQERDSQDFPWLWSGDQFIGERVNDVHLTNTEKQAARSKQKGPK